ncbi:hypothetical protein ACIBCA_09015 [Kitasatospora sp. NPDC051170]|uniref:hypothetical protein n=1 Tax=Kitasatospora sp. NPDC051170 TaxID=3364056 RepID=UPI0037A8D8A1
MDLSGATVKGGLMLPGARLVDDRGAAALRADHISVEGGVDLAGVRASGAVQLDSARVVGPLTLSGARLGVLDASGARVEGAMSYALIVSGWTLATTLVAGATRILVRP